MRWLPLYLLIFLASCSKQGPVPAADAPHATVVMRDGTQVPGKVLASSASELKLAGDDGIERTIPMTQVRAVDYGEVPSAPLAAAAPASEPPASPGVPCAFGWRPGSSQTAADRSSHGGSRPGCGTRAVP
jgi:hypothetical protein